MAKKTTFLYKLVSALKTGYYFVGEKSLKKATTKIVCRKYDPMLNMHTVFREAKLASGKKR